MAKLYLEIEKKQVRVKKNIERDLFWYDQSTGQMYRFRGGKLVMKYDPSSQKTYPVVEDHSEYVYDVIDNKDNIEDWIDSVGIRQYNIERDRFESDGQGIGIEFSDRYKNQIEYALDRYNIRHREI